jgi:hypothetical protein
MNPAVTVVYPGMFFDLAEESKELMLVEWNRSIERVMLSDSISPMLGCCIQFADWISRRQPNCVRENLTLSNSNQL